MLISYLKLWLLMITQRKFNYVYFRLVQHIRTMVASASDNIKGTRGIKMKMYIFFRLFRLEKMKKKLP